MGIGSITSKSSFRIRGLDLEFDDFEREVDAVVTEELESAQRKADRSFSVRRAFRGPPSSWRARKSLTPHQVQERKKCATISCPSKSEKKAIVKRMTSGDKGETFLPRDKPTEIDDTFSGLTVLHCPADAVVDICLVHGINGNAMDTFAKHHGSLPNEPPFMWARDFVQRAGLRDARTMTYGYDSRITDNRTTAGCSDFAENMLDLLDAERDQGMKRKRPIIFVGYSYGGFVTREAAVSLFGDGERWSTILLKNCGFVFLGTPHHGSHEAEIGIYKLAVATKLGFNDKLLRQLAPLSPNEKIATRQWNKFYTSSRIPVECFVEGEETPIPPLRKFKRACIVHERSARWMNKEATPLLGCDHHSICAFSSEFNHAFELVYERLFKMKDFLNQRVSAEPLDTAPGAGMSAHTAIIEHRFIDDPFANMKLKEDANITKHAGTELTRERIASNHMSAIWNMVAAAVVTILATAPSGSPQMEKAQCPSSPATNEAIRPTNAEIRPPGNAPGRQTESSKAQNVRSSSSTGYEKHCTKAWKARTVLSFDDGGSRAYVSLLMLKALMTELKQKASDDLPCHYFDFIVGTGTGGLIAIMLGRLRMSVDDCLENLSKMTIEAFKRSRILGKRGKLKQEQRAQILKTSLIDTIRTHEFGSQAEPAKLSLGSPSDLCKTSVLAYNSSSRRPRLFRSYDNATRFSRISWPPSRSADLSPIWLIARAACARPQYFSSVTIESEKYVDGGFSFRNPSGEMIREVHNLIDDEKDSLECLLSIGCGTPKDSGLLMSQGKRKDRETNEKIAACDADSIHNHVESVMHIRGEPYFRFDFESEVWKLPIDSFHYKNGSKSLRNHDLDQEVSKALAEPLMRQSITDCATILIRQRNARSLDKDRWERFQSATGFRHAADPEPSTVPRKERKRARSRCPCF